MKRLREDLIHALTVTLVAVLLTTVALYPVILSLNRKVLDFSREVVKGNLEMASVLGAAIAKRDSIPMRTISASRCTPSHSARPSASMRPECAP